MNGGGSDGVGEGVGCHRRPPSVVGTWWDDDAATGAASPGAARAWLESWARIQLRQSQGV